MATYVKGDVVPNARGYSLHKLDNSDGNTLYLPIDRKLTGQHFYGNTGRVGNDGKIIDEAGWACSSMININDLADLSETEGCVEAFGVYTGNASAAVYRKKDDYSSSSFVISFSANDFGNSTKLSNLMRFLDYGGAKYVVFCKPGDSIWVNTKNELNFCLDDYPDKLPAGQTHTLVAKSIGDGVEYADSPYSVEPVQYEA